MPKKIATIRIERDERYPELIFRAILCEKGKGEVIQILPCTFEDHHDVLCFFNILEQFLADGGVIKKSA
jgi:hypothetical protein